MESGLPDDLVDTCRICSGPAEPDEPLFHPCKCSGTIRYIHQSCLTTWLQHSKKRSCDVCKTEYAFQKVYDPNMPGRLPPLLFFRRLAVQIFHWTLLGLRALIVAAVWLAFLPYTTVWVWRFYFWTGGLIAWKAYGEPKPNSPLAANRTVSQNSTLHISSSNSSSTPFAFGRSPLLHDLWSDIFAGQIIASLIIVLFLAIFLLREWITQNARPGIFGEAVMIDGMDEAIPLQAAAPQPLPALPAQPIPAVNEFNNADLIEVAAARARARAWGMDGRPVIPMARRARPAGQENARLVLPAQDTNMGLIPMPAPEAAPPLPFPLTGPIPSSSNRLKRDKSNSENEGTSSDDDTLGNKEYQPHRDPNTELARMRKRREKYFTPKSGGDSLRASSSAPQQMSSSGLGGTSGSPFRFTFTPPQAVAPLPDVEQLGFTFGGSSPHSPQDPISVPLPPSPPPGEIDGPTSSIPAIKHRRGKSKSTHKNGEYTVGPRIAREPKFRSENASGGDNVDITNWIEQRGSEAFRFNLPEGWTLPTTSTSPTSSYALPAQSQFNETSLSSTEPTRSRASSWESWKDLGIESSTSSSPALVIPNSNSSVSSEETDSFGLDQALLPLDARTSDISGPSPSANPSLRDKKGKAPIFLRSPHLPTAMTNDNLPPPSPRPVHARPSPLPATLPQLTSKGSLRPSPLQDDSPSESKLATYQPPEESETEGPSFSSSHAPLFSSTSASPEHLPSDMDLEDNDEGTMPGLDAEAIPLPPSPYFPEIPPPTDPAATIVVDAPVQVQEQVDDEAEEADAGADAHDGEGDGLNQNGEGEQIDEDGVENPEGVEDDMDGLLEAVGMRGPILGIVQNVSLMTFILDMTIGAAIWVPFTIGKILALNLMKPRRLLLVLHFPIRAVRIVTDPVVDGFLWFIRPAAVHLFRTLSEVWKIKVISKGASSSIDFETMYQHVTRRLSQIFPSAIPKILGSQGDISPAPYSSVSGLSGLQRLGPIVNRLLAAVPLPTPKDHSAHLSSEKLNAVGAVLIDAWQKLALHDGPREQLFAIVLGYTSIATIAILFLNSGIMFNGATRILRSIIRQQLIVIKVAVFIIIELVVFPFGCGVILDISTLPLFPDASIWSRLQFGAGAPVTAAFFHWMLGTMFMYQFAMLLASCRSLMRKGALWFIKDPQDPTFHPIRDILDRPTFSQLRKLGISAMMYSFVISGGVGAAIYYLRHFWSPYGFLFPLRWDTRNPISQIPIDLLFLHLVVPPIIKSIRLRSIMNRATTAWWEHAAHELRLTSYMFGERVADEEVVSRFTWKRLPLIRKFVQTTEIETGEPEQDGSFVRAPAGDTIAFPEREKQMLVPTNEAGAPLDEAGQRIIQLQNEAARKAHRNVDEDYQVIYLPPHFKYRVIAFIVYLWLTSVTFATMAIGTPILLGRLVLDSLITRTTHDGYSLMIGGGVMWAVGIVGRFIVREYQAQRKAIEQARVLQVTEGFPIATTGLSNPVTHVLKGLAVRAAKLLWLTYALGLILPLLLALVIELYIILPIRVGMSPKEDGHVPTIHIWEDWALGLVLGNIGLRMARMQPQTSVARLWDNVRRRGLDADIVVFTRDFIVPIGGGLVLMIVVPAGIPYAINLLFNTALPDQVAIRAVYPTIFIAACIGQAIGSLSALLEKWAQSVRDTEFLIDLRLQNLEPDGRHTVPDIPLRNEEIPVAG